MASDDASAMVNNAQMKGLAMDCKEKEIETGPDSRTRLVSRMVVLEDNFTIDLLTWTEGKDESLHYRVSLCATGRQNLPEVKMAIGYSQSLVAGTVAYHIDDGEWFTVLDRKLRFPDGMSAAEATTLLAAIFEDSGKGAAVDEDWVWRPINLEQFLRNIFDSPRHRELANLFRQAVRKNNK